MDRVRQLLPVDPSSACQRVLNAAIHDLRNKIIVAGLDIAQEAASRFRLPDGHSMPTGTVAAADPHGIS
jgi:hypothetical protein